MYFSSPCSKTPIPTLSAAILVPTVATLAHFTLTQPVAALTQPVHPHALGIAILSAVLPVFITSATIRRICTARTALIDNLGPMLTIFFGCWLLNEPLSWWQMAGAGLVLAGVLLISKRSKPVAAPAAVPPPQGLATSNAG